MMANSDNPMNIMNVGVHWDGIRIDARIDNVTDEEFFCVERDGVLMAIPLRIAEDLIAAFYAAKDKLI